MKPKIYNRFETPVLNDKHQETLDKASVMCEGLEALIMSIGDGSSVTIQQINALGSLEQCHMWITKFLKDCQNYELRQELIKEEAEAQETENDNSKSLCVNNAKQEQ